MTKGKFGLSPAAVAVIAFSFAALRQPIPVLLVCGFALLAEKDEWLGRQTLQAVLLTLAYYLAELVTSWIFGGLARFFSWLSLYGAAGAMSTTASLLSDLLHLALLVFSVLAALRLLRGREAALPLIGKMAGQYPPPAQQSWTAPPPPAQPQQAQHQYAPSAQPSVPLQAQYTPSPPVQAPPAAAPRLCPTCSAVLAEDSRFCAECGTKTE